MEDRHAMLRHADIWRAIDGLAELHGMSPSGLARRAGLDPTSFNRSKRGTHGGKRRWPGSESVAKILNATGTSFVEFAALIDGPGAAGAPRRLASLPVSRAQAGTCFGEDGRPLPDGWDEVLFPNLTDPNCYLLEIDGSQWEPAYRDGDQLVVSPGESIRRGDRVVVKTAEGPFIFGRLSRRSMRRIELDSMDAEGGSLTLDAGLVAWMSRVIWVGN
jgi:phage repressor protein C with HTH and peptisase S24 domain